MNQRKFWRVNASGWRKPHLTNYYEGQGTDKITLCGYLIEHQRGAVVITEPDLKNDCHLCLMEAGLVPQKNRRPSKSSEDARKNLHEHLIKYCIPKSATASQKKALREQISEYMNQIAPRKPRKDSN